MLCPECETSFPGPRRTCPHCGARIPSRKIKKSQDHHLLTSGERVRQTELGEEGEFLLWNGTFSFKGLIHSWLLAILLTAFLLLGGVWIKATPSQWNGILALLGVVWVGLFLWLIYQKLNVHYELTSQRLIHREGILWRHTDRIELIDIDDVAHLQGIVERLFDVGTIQLATSDRTHPLIELPGIDHVDHVAALIDDARRRERIRRGIHVETI